jgi:hypothetical protein
MAILNTILSEVVKLSKPLRQANNGEGAKKQNKLLLQLLDKAKNTEFGKYYQFSKLLKSENPVFDYQESIPIVDYDSIYNSWWYKTIEGKTNVCWPGKVKFFALTSGTSQAASKRIPITPERLKSILRTSTNQLLTLSDYNLPKNFYSKRVLILGGSTDLAMVSDHFEGDLSGILSSKLPIWFNHFYKPGKKIASEKDWNEKLELIVKSARDWDIGVIAGVPAWVQILIERIIKYYGVSNIHEIWPNFIFYIHGGVHFEPYKESFNKLLGQPVYFQNTYLASEGYFAYQNGAKSEYMELVIHQGTFYEFISFNDTNFNHDGSLKDNPSVLLLGDVEINIDYAMVISTNGGAWRYIIGDTIKFKSLDKYEIVISGRVKHYISLCGEHLSVENMNDAIKYVAEKFSISIKEYTVAGFSSGEIFAHKWFIGSDDVVDEQLLKLALDDKLKELNDDYKTERMFALTNVVLKVLPTKMFYGWMKQIGKEGGQHKFPRVLNKDRLVDWEQYLTVKSQIL